MLGLGTQEILIVFGVIVLLFGGSKIAQLGKGMGEGIREFKSSLNGLNNTDEPTTSAKAKAHKEEGVTV